MGFGWILIHGLIYVVKSSTYKKTAGRKQPGVYYTRLAEIRNSGKVEDDGTNTITLACLQATVVMQASSLH